MQEAGVGPLIGRRRAVGVAGQRRRPARGPRRRRSSSAGPDKDRRGPIAHQPGPLGVAERLGAVGAPGWFRAAACRRRRGRGGPRPAVPRGRGRPGRPARSIVSASAARAADASGRPASRRRRTRSMASASTAARFSAREQVDPLPGPDPDGPQVLRRPDRAPTASTSADRLVELLAGEQQREPDVEPFGLGRARLSSAASFRASSASSSSSRAIRSAGLQQRRMAGQFGARSAGPGAGRGPAAGRRGRGRGRPPGRRGRPGPGRSDTGRSGRSGRRRADLAGLRPELTEPDDGVVEGVDRRGPGRRVVRRSVEPGGPGPPLGPAGDGRLQRDGRRRAGSPGSPPEGVEQVDRPAPAIGPPRGRRLRLGGVVERLGHVERQPGPLGRGRSSGRRTGGGPTRRAARPRGRRAARRAGRPRAPGPPSARPAGSPPSSSKTPSDRTATSIAPTLHYAEPVQAAAVVRDGGWSSMPVRWAFSAGFGGAARCASGSVTTPIGWSRAAR